jgi:hypothetical protein
MFGIVIRALWREIFFGASIFQQGAVFDALMLQPQHR